MKVIAIGYFQENNTMFSQHCFLGCFQQNNNTFSQYQSYL